MLSIGKYLKYKLSGITATISALNLPVNADQLQNYIVYNRTSEVPEYSNDGLAENLTTVKIDVVNKDYIDGVIMAEAVRLALEWQKGSFQNIIVGSCELTDADEFTDGSVYVQSLTFEFQTN